MVVGLTLSCRKATEEVSYALGKQWLKKYDFSSTGFRSEIDVTSDGNYIVVGYTREYSKKERRGIHLISFDKNGDTLWTKKFMGLGYSIQQTEDGGYIIGGMRSSCALLLRADSKGDTIWSNTFGGDKPYSSRFLSVRQTKDGGFIATGHTLVKKAGDFCLNNDVYLVKVDSLGEKIWSKKYGGKDGDYGYSIQQTKDGGYIVAGETRSFGEGVISVYLIKTDSNGDTLWTRIYGNSEYASGKSVRQTTDEGFIIVGSSGGIFVVKTDKNGNMQWEKRYGDPCSDFGEEILQTRDFGYLIVGGTESFGPHLWDIYVIRTDSLGDALWTGVFGDSLCQYAKSVKNTSDGGYIVLGEQKRWSLGGSPLGILLLKLKPEE